MKSFLLGALTAAALISAPAAQAATATGSMWFVDAGLASSSTFASFANVPLTPADITFSVPTDPLSLTNAGNSASDTVGAFLASGGGSCLTGCGLLSNVLNNTLWYFTGNVSVTNGQLFSVGHDDGLTLEIGGLTVIDAPGPTSPTITDASYTGPTGTFDYRLVYGECCGGPAELIVDLPFSAAVPEPSTWAMLILGFAGVGFMGYRRSRKDQGLPLATA